ncbi:hypothetical protein B0H12DRAFT_1241110 [Mycena haematopus]|nr:hypothetical protein B0H12DRAFT_1241110 [Mycena haematopus]
MPETYPGDQTKYWVIHIATARHKRRANQRNLPADADPEEVESIPGRILCATCNTHIPNKDWDRHQATTIHPTIKNTTPFSKISIVSMTLASNKGSQTHSPFSVGYTPNRAIGYNMKYSFTVTFRQNHNGRAENRLEILFEDLQLRKRFIIARILRVVVGDRSDHESLRPIALYKPRKRTARQPETNVVEGILPPSLKAVPYVVQLPKAPIPANLASALLIGSTTNIVANIRRLFLPHFLGNQGKITIYGSPALAGRKFLTSFGLFQPQNRKVTVT